jgi:tetratricopeptide (TPR) repeat protein
MGFYYDSLDDCNKLIELDPNYSGAYYTRGCTHEKLDELDKAINDYTKVLNLDPNHVNAVFARGACLNKKGEFHRAIGILDIKLKRLEDYKDALQKDDAKQMLTIQRLASKRRSYNTRLELNPFNQEILPGNNPGIIREDETVFKTTTYSKTVPSVKLDGGNQFRTTTTEKSRLTEPSRNKDLLEDIKVSLESSKTDTKPTKQADLYHDKGFKARKTGNFEDAIRMYSRALEIAPDHHKVTHFWLMGSHCSIAGLPMTKLVAMMMPLRITHER